MPKSLAMLKRAGLSRKIAEAINAAGTRRPPEGRISARWCDVLIPLMEERFQLRIDRETKNLPMFALTVAKNGSKMKLANDEEAKGRSFGIRGTEITAF